MDFIVGLPWTRRQNDSIWVVVDRMTKSAHFIPVKSTYSAKYYAKIYIDEIVSRHGIPLFIISNREHNSHLCFRDHFKKCWV